MEEEGINRIMERITSFQELQRIIKREDDVEYAKRFIRFGTVWLLPDCETRILTRFGASGFHPWVVIEDYRAPSPVIRCALRTTREQLGSRALFVRGGVIKGLTSDGWIVLT